MTAFFAVVGGIVCGVILWVLAVVLAMLLFFGDKDAWDKAAVTVGLASAAIAGGVAAWLML